MEMGYTPEVNTIFKTLFIINIALLFATLYSNVLCEAKEKFRGCSFISIVIVYPMCARVLHAFRGDAKSIIHLKPPKDIQ